MNLAQTRHRVFTPLPHDVPPPAVPSAVGPVSRWAQVPKGLFFGTIALCLAYLATAAFTFGLRVEQVSASLLMVATCFWNARTRRFFNGMAPLFLAGVLYDCTHLTEPLVRHLHVHMREPHAFDRALFGIASQQGRLTPNEFFALHHASLADFFAGLCYLLYLYVAVAFAGYLMLGHRTPQQRTLLLRFGWTFLLVNVAGFATYYLYPAAPPWYVATHGFGPPDFSVVASPAAAARWDALTGLHYFAKFYGRSADVFGAIPSLHVTYPLMVWLYARELKRRWLSVTTAIFFAAVALSAVYLQHHFVLDVLLGAGYGVLGYQVDLWLQRRRLAWAS